MNRIEQIRQMLQEEPDDLFLRYALGLELKKIDQFQEAIEVFESLPPSYLPRYYQLGKIHEDMSRVEEAIAVYKQGELLARSVGDLKTANELAEAVWMLED